MLDMHKIEERLASFYLGQMYDLTQKRMLDTAVHYDARDLTTHAVCLGMTGSGKTGLGVILLEEAALDKVPSLVIDPKGDMTNLLLTFPHLRPEDFRPWVNADDARRKGVALDAYAGQVADLWREGLNSSGQGPDRIRRLKECAEFTIFTPGSSAGHRVSILHTLKAPAIAWDANSELLRDKIESIVSALLALLGIKADPVRSREHILLANIFEHAWRNGQDLDLAHLILHIQKPPFTQLGVFPLDTFFPETERMELAMLLNGLIASPTFADWIEGQPLDVNSLLYSPTGKPRVSVLYIAHLPEVERQFFVTLLLEQVLSWMRTQSGTTSLRALLYMDEVFGYLPPHPSNPPSKKPLLALLKQARAFGLGLILTTQNPVDLDYKALSNAGTWFIGRMQTDRDKQRLLDGLEGIQEGKGGASRAELDKTISTLRSRVFLLHNVHRDTPFIFHTRWAMSYLRGPLTRDQVQDLLGEQAVPVPPPPTPPQAALPPQPQPEPVPAQPYNEVPPQLPSIVKQVFLPVQVPLEIALAELGSDRGWSARSEAERQGYLVYEPALIGLAQLRFPHAKSRQAHSAAVVYLLSVAGESYVVDWSAGQVQLDIDDVDRKPEPDAYFAELPADLGTAKRLNALKDEFADYLYYNSALILQYNPHFKLYSMFGESAKAFQRRCRQAAKGSLDAEAQKLKTKYKRELDRIQDRLQREERELERDEIEYDARKQEELLSGIESVFGFFGGRRLSTRLSTASRRRRMTRQAKADIKESEDVIEELEQQLAELEEEATRELEDLTAKWSALIDEVEQEEVRPRRADVRIDLFALAWIPHWQVQAGDRALSTPAFEAQPA
jgi:hypothetical protein